MTKFIRYTVAAGVLLAIIACGLSTNTPEANTNAVLADVSVVALTVQAQNATTPFNTVGQIINYVYVVKNNGATPLEGPVLITDDKATVQCPDLTTIGNNDAFLDSTESLTCTSSYSITQADIDAGSVTNVATARVGAINSNTTSAVVNISLNKVLTMTVTANPVSYNQAGQTITYTYTVKNTGATALGPAQFVVRDDRIPTPINCGPATTTLATDQTVTCTSTYAVTPTDMTVSQLISNASATGAGAGTIQPASVIVTNTNVSPAPSGGGSSAFPRGSTVQHNVIDGEWMIQIARCYGADFDAVRNANPGIIDPDLIYPNTKVSVPNVGSNGTIYGPPCIAFYTAQSGDTWASIAAKFNADILVLQEANRDISSPTAGKVIKVPLNSAGGGVVQPPPSTGPTRLTIPAGTNTVAVNGTVTTPGTVHYVIAATAGQILNIKVTIATNDVSTAVYGPNQAVLKALDPTLSWSGTVAATGDQFIDIVSNLGNATKTFTLEVTLSAPVVVSPVQRVTDLNAGPGDSNPAFMTVFNNQLYFQANANNGTGTELWKYDAALQAASFVKDINAGAGNSDPAFLVSYSNLLYFRANGNDGAGAELWRFNGTDAGRVTDLNAGAGDSNPSYLTVFNNSLYFSANGNDGTGNELWVYDGTRPSRVADINAGPGDSNPSHLAVFNSALYFSATSTDGGTELWKYDGTTASRVADINVGVGNSSPAFLTVFNNALYFSANGNDGTGVELWKYDGTNAPSRAADVNPGAGDSVPTFLTVFNNALYFSATGDTTGIELWKFDGTTASRVADINTADNSSPAYLAVYNNELYFQANGNDGAGRELWKYKP